jgi:hypothetical protein
MQSLRVEFFFQPMQEFKDTIWNVVTSDEKDMIQVWNGIPVSQAYVTLPKKTTLSTSDHVGEKKKSGMWVPAL